jgi:predicted PurR-regulated permease PerM
MNERIPRSEITPEVELQAQEPVDEQPPRAAEVVRERATSDVVLTGLFVLAVLYTLYFARAVLLPLVLAILLTLILSPAVAALNKLRIPQPIGAAVVVALLLAVLGFSVGQLFDPAEEWLDKAPKTLRDMERKLRGIKKSVEEVTKAAEKVGEIAAVQDTSKATVAVPEPRLFSRILTGAQSFLVSVLSTVILLYFLLASGDMFLRKVVRVMPTFTDKKRAVEMARTIETEMARYLFTITCINLGLGVATGVAMYLLGMPNPVLWGVMVAVFNFVPYLGAGVSLIILTLVAFLSFDTISQILLAPAAFLVLTTLEGQILTPIITGRRLTLHPVVIFIGMLFWGWLWGIVGALMAVPILVTFKIICDHVDSLAPIGKFLSAPRSEVAEG